ncbi:MAG: sulfatase [Bdellovibrionaceae bacterium]|nr:sulfatase [Pseudobdellovibrionaceae bacterium]
MIREGEYDLSGTNAGILQNFTVGDPPVKYFSDAVGRPILQNNSNLPNIIIILVDDMGYADIGPFGASDIATPHLDTLASEGIKLTSYYAYSVCTPTRAALMTGTNASRINLGGVLSQDANKGLHPDEITLAEKMKDAGYATAHIGKWHLGYGTNLTSPNHGFDYWYGTIASNNTDINLTGYTFSGNCVFREGWTLQSATNATIQTPLFADNVIIEVPTDQSQFTRRYTAETIRFIEENKDQPFFIYLAHNMPHIPLHVSSEFLNDPQSAIDYNLGARGLYGDVIQELDWSVGQVLQALEDNGLEENTLVIFTSDNGASEGGGGSNAPFSGWKGERLEGGVRVSFIARWPGKIPAGTTSNETATVMDLYPTLIGLTGGTVPTDRILDCEDIWPILSGVPGATTPHDNIFHSHGAFYRAVRAGDWKYSNENGNLYNLNTDIAELTPLNAQEPAKLQELMDIMSAAAAELSGNKREAGVAEYTPQ